MMMELEKLKLNSRLCPTEHKEGNLCGCPSMAVEISSPSPILACAKYLQE
jgi:hypothetical protein